MSRFINFILTKLHLCNSILKTCKYFQSGRVKTSQNTCHIEGKADYSLAIPEDQTHQRLS
jgi:hypothetical protein